MKQNIFIGSSVEGLPIAYSIQDNLQFTANVTVWDQGIFELSSTALDDLIKALDEFDFGIFVFKPDDLLQIRDNQFNAVRDNVLFEFGLFIGRLGKDKVFFLTPEDANNFHLPTDLIGVNKGTYNANREDGRLKAALGPFCNQVRLQIEKFVIDKKFGLAPESKKAKDLVLRKPNDWEFSLAGELLATRLVPINKRFEDLKNGKSFLVFEHLNAHEYHKFYRNRLADYSAIINILKKVYLEDFESSLGEEGEPGSVSGILEFANSFASICIDLFGWEQRLCQTVPPENLKKVQFFMLKWSRGLMQELNTLPPRLQSACNLKFGENIDLGLNIPDLVGGKQISDLFEFELLKNR